MTDYSGLCRQILDVALQVRRGERIWVSGWDHTTGLVSKLAEESRRRGCKAVSTIKEEATWFRSLRSGPVSSLDRLSPEQRAPLDETDSYIFTLGPRHPVDWRMIPKSRRGLATIWFLEENSFAEEWRSVARRRNIKMLGIEATLATRERANALGVDFGNYAETMYAGCLADPRQMAERAKRLSSVLRKSGEVRVSTPAGTNLSFRLDERGVEVSQGKVSNNQRRSGRPIFLPAGAVGTTVDEKSANGVIVYDKPIRARSGTIENLRLLVEDGRVREFSASRNAEAFREYLGESGGDSDRFAFVGFGLNPRLRPGYTQDDKVLGLIELNFGENVSRGGKNRGSGNFWGAVSKASVTAGGRTIMKAGRLLV